MKPSNQLNSIFRLSLTFPQVNFAQSAGAIEYTNCTSAEW